MKTVTMLEFRKNAERILRQASAGTETVLTYRGKPMVRINPIAEPSIAADDAFYRIGRLAEKVRETGASMTNADMDKIIYGA